MSRLDGDRKPSLSRIHRGQEGERKLLRYLSELQEDGEILTFFRPDAAAIGVDGTCFLIETKDQDMFESPPFDGHGLNASQAEKYRLFHDNCGVDTELIIFDGESCYRGMVSALEGRGSAFVFDTKGTSSGQRRVYALTGFVRERLAWGKAA
jgi:hypothetical protein